MAKKDKRQSQKQEEKKAEPAVFIPSTYPEHAGVLSCLFAGLGQFYNGERKKAAILGAVYAALLVVYYLATKELIPIPWRMWLIPVLAVWLYAQVDAFIVAHRKEKDEKQAFLSGAEPGKA